MMGERCTVQRFSDASRNYGGRPPSSNPTVYLRRLKRMGGIWDIVPHAPTELLCL